MIVCVVGPLTDVENIEELKVFYEKLGLLCQKLGIDSYLPHTHVKDNGAAPNEIYTTCKQHVLKSDLIIACVNNTSLGVGAELEIANANGIPIILISYAWVEVSHMILGMQNIVKILCYVEEDDIFRQLEEYLEKFV